MLTDWYEGYTFGEASFLDTISRGSCIMLFTAPWSGASKAVIPLLDELYHDYKATVKMVS